MKGVPFGWIVMTLIPASGVPSYDPIERYESRELRGWRVRIHQDLLADPVRGGPALELLDHQLAQIVRRVPKEALEKLRQVPIWVELKESHHPCMAYHPDARWLEEHDMNPKKAGGVEIANAETFLAWTLDQPWMVLHELAHAYHHRFIPGGFDNEDIRSAYRAAVESHTYESVLHVHGGRQPAYALKDPQEYFAEGSEAYFGTNDFYPFVRAELRAHDPRLYKVLERLWHSPPPLESQDPKKPPPK
jgi:hypothetical protein